MFKAIRCAGDESDDEDDLMPDTTPPDYRAEPLLNRDVADTLRRLESNDRTLVRLKIDLRTNSSGDTCAHYTVRCASYLAQVLSKNTVLTDLSLSAAHIGDCGVAPIARALCHNHTLTRLNLDSNMIEQQGATDLAMALQENTSLTTLSLNKNQLGEQDALRLIGTVMAHNVTLNCLKLNDNHTSDQLLTSIWPQLQLNTSLTRLTTTTQRGDAVTHIPNWMKRNTSMSLKVICDRLRSNDRTLKVLDFSDWNCLTINNTLARDIAEALHHNTNLHTLEFGKQNAIGDLGAHRLADALKHNNTLTRLDLGDQGYKSMQPYWDFRYPFDQIGPSGLLKLAMLSFARESLHIDCAYDVSCTVAQPSLQDDVDTWNNKLKLQSGTIHGLKEHIKPLWGELQAERSKRKSRTDDYVPETPSKRKCNMPANSSSNDLMSQSYQGERRTSPISSNTRPVIAAQAEENALLNAANAKIKDLQQQVQALRSQLLSLGATPAYPLPKPMQSSAGAQGVSLSAEETHNLQESNPPIIQAADLEEYQLRQLYQRRLLQQQMQQENGNSISTAAPLTGCPGPLSNSTPNSLPNSAQQPICRPALRMKPPKLVVKRRSLANATPDNEARVMFSAESYSFSPVDNTKVLTPKSVLAPPPKAKGPVDSQRDIQSVLMAYDNRIKKQLPNTLHMIHRLCETEKAALKATNSAPTILQQT